MMPNNSFARICRALEHSTIFQGTAADWLRRLADRASEARDHFALCQRAFLQKEQKPAAHIFCPQCLCHHEVFIWTEERIAALCNEVSVPWNPWSSPPTSEASLTSSVPLITASCRCDDDPGCPDLSLTPADIEVWSVSWSRFARALGTAFGLTLKLADLNIANTWQIGSWSSDAVPVILTIQPGSARLRSVILELLCRWRERFILLAPTAAYLDAPCLELLAQAKALFLPLESNLLLTHNATLQPVRAPGELFRQFNPEPVDTDFSEARRIFGLVQQLDSEIGMKAPSILTVFRLYCIEELSIRQIARKFRCGKTTISNRLLAIQERIGTDPTTFRRISSHLDLMVEQSSDPRARKIYRSA